MGSAARHVRENTRGGRSLAQSAYLAEAKSTTRTVVREIQVSGVETRAGIARTLQARGVKTPRGRADWQPVQVSRLLAV